MLPCTLPDAGTTVLVVPLVALRGDLLRRLRELRIEHIEWQLGERRDAPLVIVSVEAAGTKDFCKYARVLISQQKLDRIVVDECHLTVTAVEYRPSMVDLTAIRVLRTQSVYLTGTLPPSIQTEFEERNHLVRPRTIRAPSNRPNLYYMVRQATDPSWGSGSLLQQCAAEARDAWEVSTLFNRMRDQIILYVRTREEATELASMLRCDQYTAKSGTDVEKRAVLDRWTGNPDQPYIVATTALAEGFDYPHVRLVINVNEPESPTIFAQETGRAGRDGAKAYSLVVLPSTWEAFDHKASTVTRKSSSRLDPEIRKGQERRAMHKYLRSGQCFRQSLEEWLDVDDDRFGCREEEVECEVCESRVSTKAEEGGRIGLGNGSDEVWEGAPQSSGLDAIDAERVWQEREVSLYREHLAAIQGICGLCRVVGDHWEHPFWACRRRPDVFQAKRDVRERLRASGKEWIQPYKACFWCLNPQGICERASTRQGGRTEERSCEFADVVLPVCYGVWSRRGGRRWIEEEFGRKLDRVEEFMEWIGKTTEFGGGEAIQGVR
ncbi:hypothetical protein KC316_g18705, partial [Hortaea werneckii]